MIFNDSDALAAADRKFARDFRPMLSRNVGEDADMRLAGECVLRALSGRAGDAEHRAFDGLAPNLAGYTRKLAERVRTGWLAGTSIEFSLERNEGGEIVAVERAHVEIQWETRRGRRYACGWRWSTVAEVRETLESK